jgi:hypothetical protein
MPGAISSSVVQLSAGSSGRPWHEPQDGQTVSSNLLTVKQGLMTDSTLPAITACPSASVTAGMPQRSNRVSSLTSNVDYIWSTCAWLWEIGSNWASACLMCCRSCYQEGSAGCFCKHLHLSTRTAAARQQAALAARWLDNKCPATLCCSDKPGSSWLRSCGCEGAERLC